MIFFAHPKTASKAVRQLLEQEFGFTRVLGHHDITALRPGPAWTTFAVVRNHWDAWASWFAYGGGRGYDFSPEYIDFWMRRLRGRFYPRANSMYPLDAAGWLDAVLRYETLDADLSWLLGREVTLPQVNVTLARRGRHYSLEYNDRTRDYVAGRFAEEIERYGYEFEDVRTP